MLHSFDINPKSTTVKNPQVNSVIERVHLTIRDRCGMEEIQFNDRKEKLRSIFKSIAWVVRSTAHSVTKYTPGQLAFGVDMLMRIRIIADWESIKANKLRLPKMSNEQENKSRVAHNYKKGGYILIILKRQEDELNKKCSTLQKDLTEY